MMYINFLLLAITLASYACCNPFGSEKRPEPGPIIFSSNVGQNNGNRALFTMNEDNTNLQRLTNDSYTYNSARWSPDGEKLVFISSRNKTSTEGSPIFIMDVKSGNLTQIVDVGWAPAWSRDGRKLAYSKDPRYGGWGRIDIHILDLESKIETNVRANPAFDDYVGDWSFEENVLLIWSDDTTDNPGSDDELYFLNIEDGSVVRLTDNEVHDTNARLSPDGSKIVYSTFTGTDWDLFIMDTNGGNKRNLTNDDKVFNDSPAWSPDGTKIVFSASDGPGLGGALSIQNIYLINIDGTGLQQLTNASEKEQINRTPDWRWQ